MKFCGFENLFNKICKWFNEDRRKITIFTILFGFMINILLITADIIGTDAVVFTETYVATPWDLSLGRFALYYSDILRFGISSSVIMTLLSLIYMAFLVNIVIELFNIKNTFSKYLFCAIAVSCPFFYETLFSTFCSAEYILSCLLASMAVYIVYKWKNNFKNIILASLFLAFSLGLYQSHLAVATSLCILLPLNYILKNEYDFKYILKKLVLSLLMGILGVILYEVILNIILNVTNVSLASYSGANEIGIKNLLLLPTLIKNAYLSFIYYFFNDNIVNNRIYYRNYLHMFCFIILALAVVIHIYELLRSNKKINWYEIILIIICILITPICFSIVELIAPDRDLSQLMASGFLMFYIFLLSMIEFKKENNLKNILNFSGILMTFAVFFTLIVMANATYMAVRITKNKMVTQSERIMDIILSDENYNLDMPIMFAGNGESDTGFIKQRTNGIYNYASGFTAISPLVWSDKFDNCNRGWRNFINYYLGISIKTVDHDKHLEILNNNEFKVMPVYPVKGSIKIIDNVMVVKLDAKSSTK